MLYEIRLPMLAQASTNLPDHLLTLMEGVVCVPRAHDSSEPVSPADTASGTTVKQADPNTTSAARQ
jgi:hypothetical protein